MQKLCTNCHYIGKSTKWNATTKVLVFLFIPLGMSFIYLGFWHPIFIIGAYISFFVSSISMDNIDALCRTCPACNHKTLIPINSRKAQDLIRQKDISFKEIPDSFWDKLSTYDCIKNTKRKICSICNKVDDKYPDEYSSMKWGLYMSAIGIFTVPLALFHPLYIALSAFFLLVGTSTVNFCFWESDRCHRCKHRSLISLNSPKGREVIEQENIQNINIIDPDVEAKLFFMDDNFGYILWIFTWAIIVFSTYMLYKYFSSF